MNAQSTITIPPERLAWLDTITLDHGSHKSYQQGVCAEEAVAYMAGLDITSSPACVSPVLRVFTIALNDAWDSTQRQKLKPYLVRQIGTAGDGQDEARSYLALDWLVRTYTPAWLDLAGLAEQAQVLRRLPRVVDFAAAEQAGPVVRTARKTAVVAAEAAWEAAAAGNTAAATVWDAAAATEAWADLEAATAAAWDAATAAAWDAAAPAAEAAGAACAGYAARSATWPATVNATRGVVTALQASALTLLDAMTDPSTVVTT